MGSLKGMRTKSPPQKVVRAWGLLLSRQNRLDGIANGIDMDEWNPEADADCAAAFTVTDMSGKLECKRALQKELGLPQRDDVPLMGFIGRLDWQKGPDLLQNALHDMMRETSR